MARALCIFVFLFFLQATVACNSCDTCGFEAGDEVKTKIVDGDLVDIPTLKYPWLVSLSHTVKKDIFCTGAIINDKFVLTATHCLLDLDKIKSGKCPSNDYCFLKDEDMEVGVWHDSDKKPSQLLKVQKAIPHPKYDHSIEDSILMYDIALLELKERVSCDDKTGPICIYRKNENQEGKELQMAGWGFSTTLGKGNKKDKHLLREGKIKIIPSKECSRSKNNTKYSDTVICAESTDNKIPCQGDSGGSLFTKIDGTYYTLGVSSTMRKNKTEDECTLSAKVRYTKVYNNLIFIESNVGRLPTPAK